MTLQTERLHTVEQIRGFLDGNGEVDFRPLDRDEAYDFVRRTLVRLDYDALGRAGKGTVREFLGKATGLSRAQVARLIGQYRETGRVEDRRGANSGRPFARVYTPADIRLLAEADEIGGQLCGPAACEVMRREYAVFGDERFERLARLSPSHLYNLRRTKTYRARRTTVEHTRPTAVRIGERRRPDPRGRPGYLRVDTVHAWTSSTLGDRNGVKGVYDINLVDEVTQYEHVGAVAGIAESFLVPLLEEMLAALPLVVLGFHADNGSEYINRTVAEMLNKLHVPDFTKSRARRSNDNALVEARRSGGLQERQRRAQVARPRPHPAALRARGERLRQGRALAVPQLPPSLPVRHRGPRRQGQGAPPLPAPRRRDALREAQVAARRGALPEARHHLRRPRRGRPRDVQPRGEPAREPRPRRTVPRHRPGRPQRRVADPRRARSARRGPAPGPPPSPGGRDRRSGRRSRTTSAGRTGAAAPFDRGDRRSLPLRVLSQWRVKGSLRRPRRLDAVPRHDAVLRRERRASVAIALDPPPTPASAPTPSATRRSCNARCLPSSPHLRCPQRYVRTGIRAQCEDGPFRLIISLENASPRPASTTRP